MALDSTPIIVAETLSWSRVLRIRSRLIIWNTYDFRRNLISEQSPWRNWLARPTVNREVDSVSNSLTKYQLLV